MELIYFLRGKGGGKEVSGNSGCYPEPPVKEEGYELSLLETQAASRRLCFCITCFPSLKTHKTVPAKCLLETVVEFFETSVSFWWAHPLTGNANSYVWTLKSSLCFTSQTVNPHWAWMLSYINSLNHHTLSSKLRWSKVVDWLSSLSNAANNNNLFFQCAQKYLSTNST